ncbi:MAG: hypothetical protein R6V12_13495, partial [Candidatus Hydrogenedentota bacterium]
MTAGGGGPTPEEFFEAEHGQTRTHTRTPIAAIKAQIEGLTEGYIEFSTAKLEQIQVEFGHIEQLV